MPAFVSFHGIPAAIRGAVIHARFRQLVAWCLPALILGGAVRAWMLLHYQYGYVHPDSADFLVTADMLLRKHHFVLHGKKAFLAPVLYALPLLVRIPTLLILPWMQHLLGLVFTLMVGELARLWTTLWRVWIIPATILATLNPAMLWYEQTLISEPLYLWCATGLALAGTICALRPGRGRFAALLAALLLTVGARPEGKLYVVFCLLLVLLVDWGAWKKRLLYGGVALLFCVAMWMSSRNTQAGVLLYATVLPLAPDVPKSAPGFAPLIDPLRKERLAWGPLVPSQLTTAEKKITGLAIEYLKSIDDQRTTYGGFCQRLAIEAARNKPLLLPVIALNKFLVASIYPSSGDFSQNWMWDRQIESCTYKAWMARLMPRLVGPALAGETPDDEALKGRVIDFLKRKYPPQPEGNLFQRLQEGWAAVTGSGRIMEQHYGAKTVPGVPVFLLLAAAGMIASLVRPGPLARLHAAWIAAMAFLFLVVMLTGVMNPRYRLVFEPFWLLYIFVLLDSVAAMLPRRKGANEQAC